MVRPYSCIVKRGIPSSRRYLPTYLPTWTDVESPLCWVTVPGNQSIELLFLGLRRATWMAS